MKIPFLLKLVTSIAVCLGAGFVGSLFTTPNIPTWYAHLQKPPFAPPNWLFGPVWTLLFILMGIAFALIWRKYGVTQGVTTALILFFIQLFFNVLWSAAFFGMRSPLLGFIDIIILLILIFVTTRYFYRVTPLSGYLLIPYALWVSFATLLNISILVLNR
jgi:tryptophan-rich sensory protein